MDKRKQGSWLVLILMAALGSRFVAAAEPALQEDDVRVQLKQAMDEIRQLRTEVAQLKESKDWGYQEEMHQIMQQNPAPAKADAAGVLTLPAGWSIQPYGYLKFDMSYDDSPVVGDNGDYAIWVSSENKQNRADDRFSFTARQSRLGMKIFAPDLGDLKVMGQVEVDFYNPEFNTENKGTPMLRHAYGQVTGADWSLLFGQTSDIISPLFPNTINYTVGWFGGNVGYRHPQLRFTKWWDGADKSRFQIETALSREIRQDADLRGVDDGQDASTPSILGRVSYASACGLKAGISGHYGKEEIDWDYAGDDDELNTWSINADLVVPVCDKVEFKGEFFWAENFDAHFGGIGQGVNTTTEDEIEAMGAWAQVGFKPCETWAFYTGGGFDDPVDGDLVDGSRSLNYFVFSNANYYFSKYLSTGIEFTYMQTDYKNANNGDNFRVQHSWMLSF